MPQTTRRSILYLAPGALISARAANKPLAVAMITEPTGTHQSLFLKGFAKCHEITSVGIADATGKTFKMAQDSLGPHAGKLRTFADYREMLRETRPALTVVSLEPHRNPPAVEAALAADSHVISEKPPCIHPEEFESMAKLANARHRQLMLGTVTRCNPAARKARELVERGWIGKQYGVTMNWTGDQTRLRAPAYQKSWLASKAKSGGGKLAFHGIHYLDLIQYISGDRIVKVAGFCRNVGGTPIEVEDAAVLALEFRNGMVGTLNTGYYLDRGNQNLIQMWGERGWFRFDPFLPLQWYSTHPDAPRGEQSTAGEGTGVEYDVSVEQAVRFVLGNGEPFMTTADSLSVVRTVFAGYRASETGVSQTVA